MPDDPNELTAQERYSEITALLAEGVLRLRQRRLQLDPVSLLQINPDSSQISLDDCATTPLHGACGLTPARATKGSEA